MSKSYYRALFKSNMVLSVTAMMYLINEQNALFCISRAYKLLLC